MLRTTITLDEALNRDLEAYIARSGAANRSEAIRDLVRRGLNARPMEQGDAPCVAVASYAIDQTMPGLAKRLREERMARHDEFLFTTSIPVDHDGSIDIAVMKTTVDRANDFAQWLFLERGVRHGVVAFTPIEEVLQHHAHGEEPPHSHAHIRVQESF